MRRETFGRFGWAVLFATLVIGAATLTRVVVFAMSDHASAGIITYARAFAAGFIFDVIVAGWFVAPVMLYLTAVTQARYPRRGQRVLRRAGLAVAIAVITFVIAAEILFFDEFDGRFNFVAADYLIYPTEVVTNIWQSYPLAKVILGIGAFTALVVWLLRGVTAFYDEHDGFRAARRWTVFAVYVPVLAALTWFTPVRLAHISDDRVLNEVALNGYYTFVQAVLGRDAPYEGLYAQRPDSEVQSRLSRLISHAPRPAPPASPLNVVVVLEESFGSEFVSTLHPRDSASITPAFDSLAMEGTLLTHAYSTGNRTVRAIEAVTASLPPLPGLSIVRRTQSHGLFTLPSVLAANGYTTEFIYAGRELFDGMAGYAKANGFSRIVLQDDMPKGSFTTAWGVADEILFDKTLSELDALQAAGKPFYAMVLTVSNHKPYTYPTGSIPQNPNEHRRTFAVRYADWALGRFMKAVKTHPFAANTLFVLMGDHGARVYGASAIPLASYEVPILFWKPGLVAAGGRFAPMASSLDVPPTILGFLGITGESKFFGRDLFGPDSVNARALVVHNNELALMRGNRMAVLGLRGVTTLHEIDDKGGLHRIASPDSAGRELIEDAIAYFQGADGAYRGGRHQFDPAHTPRFQR